MTQFGQHIQIFIKNDLPEFVLTFYNRVVECLIQKKYKFIMHLNMEEIEEQKRSLGKDYDKYVVPFMLTIHANVCFDIGEYENAIKNLYKALVLQDRMLGKKHPMVATTLNNLAVVYAKTGKSDEVEKLAQRALDIYDQSTCREHLGIIEKTIELALYFDGRGKYQDAERCYNSALRICKAKLSPDDPLIAIASNALAICDLQQGKYKDAEVIFKKVISKACKKEFRDAGDKSSWLKMLASKKIFKSTKDDSKSVINIWQVAEERERNKTKVSEEISPPLWHRPATFYAPTFKFALKGLEAIYEKQGKHVAAKTLNQYTNQQLVEMPDAASWSSIVTQESPNQVSPPRLQPKNRNIKRAKIPSPPPLPSPPPSPIPPARGNGPHRWLVSRIRSTVRPPPPALPIRGSEPGSTDSRRNNPTMRSSPPQSSPIIPPLPPVRGTGSSCEAVSPRFMVLPSAQSAEEDKSFIGTKAVPKHARFSERILAELKAELTTKNQRRTVAERTIETHEAFRKDCLNNIETGSGVAVTTLWNIRETSPK